MRVSQVNPIDSRNFIKFSMAIADFIYGVLCLPHILMKNYLVLRGHLCLWETAENCFFAVLFFLSRIVSVFLIISMVLDSYVACVSPNYYKKKFRREDSRIIVGLMWVLCFIISIWPFRHTRWQCHIYYALTSPLVINIDPHIWANMDQFVKLPFIFYFCFVFLVVLIFPVFIRNRGKKHIQLSSTFLASTVLLEGTHKFDQIDRKIHLASFLINLSSNISILIYHAFDDKTSEAIVSIFSKRKNFHRIRS
ncbi:Oidioi.mRNA.OKI2018_I69.XSR.g16430.t2.cds [Oikopleura dioica]|uniref:Oidioi.mRNA.OKI2018_I69.XSR.g16430.t2.cds n=1 Tax=Oikopleura dioica TaxID=34765 RepID=A0ABN7SHY2_OIKDI|nr:Oidioi.mRNA.OKI2018_I69.XSR.g16430.t2.cds [Oikopleura dioica]